MKPIVRVENLSKQYSIGSREAAYDTLRESIIEAVRNPLKRLRRNGKESSETIWALKDVSFRVHPGEVVGIIGRNGAGKSTLLKVLSRITEPTTGRAELFGRVASMLEVGTGFHPELTGRENIYLNGAILGMKKAEIERKFDAIVAFSELEQFLDTPVKRYSSGMYMRLAFAVASHLEPEILVVDEVLAVGDAAFQKKCLGKMDAAATEGRTVLFVSHNMVAIQTLCRRVICLDEGKLVGNGAPGAVVRAYLASAAGDTGLPEEVWDDIETAPGNDIVRLHSVRLRRERGPIGSASKTQDDERFSDFLTMKTPFVIEVEYWNLLPGAQLNITLHLYTEQDIIAFTTGNGADIATQNYDTPAGLFRCSCHVPGDLLNAGKHRFVVLVVRDTSSVIYRHKSEVSFEILDLQEREVSSYGREPGVVQPALKWTTELLGTSLGNATFSSKS